jgi:hypothetical protein
LGRVDQVMETRFAQTHCRNLEIGCVTASRARYGRLPPNAKTSGYRPRGKPAATTPVGVGLP